jgi:hypothetical protein
MQPDMKTYQYGTMQQVNHDSAVGMCVCVWGGGRQCVMGCGRAGGGGVSMVVVVVVVGSQWYVHGGCRIITALYNR